jgi:hypothetical protein
MPQREGRPPALHGWKISGDFIGHRKKFENCVIDAFFAGRFHAVLMRVSKCSSFGMLGFCSPEYSVNSWREIWPSPLVLKHLMKFEDDLGGALLAGAGQVQHTEVLNIENAVAVLASFNLHSD